MTIAAIQTKYKGHHYRSRLEARWSVFFDCLGVRFLYEPEGFEILTGGTKSRYLPDFFLPDVGCWVEVKGSLDNASDDYLNTLGAACDWDSCLPGVSYSSNSSCGLLILGQIPSDHCVQLGSPIHLIFQHNKGGIVQAGHFTGSGGFRVRQYELGRFDGADNPCTTIRRSLREYTFCRHQWYYTDCLTPSPPALAYAEARQARFEFPGRKA